MKLGITAIARTFQTVHKIQTFSFEKVGKMDLQNVYTEKCSRNPTGSFALMTVQDRTVESVKVSFEAFRPSEPCYFSLFCSQLSNSEKNVFEKVAKLYERLEVLL